MIGAVGIVGIGVEKIEAMDLGVRAFVMAGRPGKDEREDEDDDGEEESHGQAFQEQRSGLTVHWNDLASILVSLPAARIPDTSSEDISVRTQDRGPRVRFTR